MSLGNPTPAAGSNAANAASAATSPSSSGGGGTNPLASGLDGFSDALGSAGAQTQQLFGEQQNNIPSAQPGNDIMPVNGAVQAPPLNVAPPPPVAQPVAQNVAAPVAAPTVAQAPASVTAGSTIQSMMQPVTPAQQPAPANPASFAPAASIPQNQVAPTSTDPTSFLGGQPPMALQNVVSSLSNNPAGF